MALHTLSREKEDFYNNFAICQSILACIAAHDAKFGYSYSFLDVPWSAYVTVCLCACDAHLQKRPDRSRCTLRGQTCVGPRNHVGLLDGCILASPGEYNESIRAQRWYELMDGILPRPLVVPLLVTHTQSTPADPTRQNCLVSSRLAIWIGHKITQNLTYDERWLRSHRNWFSD